MGVTQVVAEFDVYLAGKLKDDLHLLQYPLRPSYRGYGDQGELFKVDMAIEHNLQTAQHPSEKQTSSKDGSGHKVPEVDSLRLHYKLETGTANYDRNAVDHRVRRLIVDNEFRSTLTILRVIESIIRVRSSQTIASAS